MRTDANGTGLVPATHDQAFALRCIQRKHPDEPCRHFFDWTCTDTFNQRFAVDVGNDDFPIVAAVIQGIDVAFNDNHIVVSHVR